MDKLKMHTPNKVDDNIKKIGELFPGVVTEAVVNGEVQHVIDFDALRQELSDVVVEGNKERYQFTWPDKKKTVLLANAPISKTLRPCREESVDFDTTENLYIEGDNLEALKLLQETYLGKIKMIYIDPPYNTGNDFVYNDDFAESTEEYLANSGQYDEDGNRLVPNLESNGRFHTDWLNMIYPRIKLSKALLKEDGIMFISINDYEIENLKKICNEVFGERNFVGNFVWNTEGHTDNQFQIKTNHEYIVVYCKNIECLELGWVIDPNTRKESNLWKGYAENSITKNGPKNPPVNVILKKGFPCICNEVTIASNNPVKEFWSELRETGYISRQMSDRYSVDYPIRLADIVVKNGKLQNDVEVVSGWANSDKLKRFIKGGFLPIEEADGKISFYLSERGVVYYRKERTHARNILSVLRNMGTTEQMRSELESDNLFFSYPKPVELIKYLISVGNMAENDLIMDFFSGSATTAHAIMKLNAENGEHRKFVMVQLPEIIDSKSDAYKAGYKNICEIGKERIRRAGKKIKDESPLTTKDLDTGFRVLKIDTSNMKDVYYEPDKYEQQSLFELADNIKPDRTPEDLLFQVMLDLGVLLSSKIEEREVNGKKVFNVADGYLVACFDQKVGDDTIKAIAEMKPYYAVFRDSGFESDSTCANFEQIFASVSPDTIKKVL